MLNRWWIFGNKSGIHFTPSPTVFARPGFNSYEGCTSISDWNGNLLFYTDGVTIWDAGGTVRATNLLGSQSSTQSAVIVPDPAAMQHRFYVFTTGGSSSGNHHLDGVLIDTTTWSTTPLSSIWTPPPTAGYSPTEKLCAVVHANGHDYWVLTVVQPTTPIGEEVASGTMRVMRVTANGVVHWGDQSLLHMVSDVGYMKASKGGIHIALANMWTTSVLVLHFSNGTGVIDPTSIVSIPVVVPPFGTGGYVYGVEFSPSAQLLYYSTLFPLPIASSPNTDGYVFQYALPNGPSVLVGTHPNNQAGDYALGGLQLAPDGLIYIAQDGENMLGVIANPDVPGVGCNVTFGALTLAPGTLCHGGLPNHNRDVMAI